MSNRKQYFHPEFLEKYSINFAQTNNQNFATFEPKQTGGIPYSHPLLYRMKDGTLKEMPRGMPGLDFLICDSGIPILVCFDTGSHVSYFDETTAFEIDI
ncbi:MAG: hypothetical protein WAM14_26425 [Candidatus Nitrosopolaris sp.]